MKTDIDMQYAFGTGSFTVDHPAQQSKRLLLKKTHTHTYTQTQVLKVYSYSIIHTIMNQYELLQQASPAKANRQNISCSAVSKRD